MPREIDTLLVSNEVSIDTVAIIAPHVICVKPCHWEDEKAETLAPYGTRRMRGGIEIAPGGQITITPYRIGSRGQRYRHLLSTPHCEVMRTPSGKIIERWSFPPTMTPEDISLTRAIEALTIDEKISDL